MGFYRALVVDNADPESRGRVRLQIPQKFGLATTTWAEPMDLGMRTRLAPAVGQMVWATFEGADESYPIYLPSLTQAIVALRTELGLVGP
jgi:hypothetical protein